ncbi:F163B protein, partial [Psilopogon haemacephalus]|nr:F163B protein [Psilopogon haemacephalus]
MTAGTVVITGGILATVILLCIIAVLCYCRLQYYCCKKDESEEDEEEPDFAVHSHIPPLHCNRNVPPTFFLQEPPEELHNGGDRISFKTVSQEEELELPVSVGNLQALNPNRLSAMRAAFSRSRSTSTDV